MNAKGHLGLALIVVFSIMSLLAKTDNYSLTIAIIVVALSTLPDIDLKFEIKHRGITHNILAGFVFGLLFGVLFEYSRIGFWIGFLGGFGGTLLHIIGDILTYMPFAPLAPFCNKKFSLGLFESSDKAINNLFFNIGAITFIIYLMFVYANVTKLLL